MIDVKVDRKDSNAVVVGSGVAKLPLFGRRKDSVYIKVVLFEMNRQYKDCSRCQ